MRVYSLRVGPDPGWLMPCWELEDSADTQRGEGHVLTEAETQGDTSPSRGTQGLLQWREAGNPFLPESPRKNLLPTPWFWISGLLSWETVCP